MRICLIADRPDHPVLGAAMAIPAPRHETRVLLGGGLSDAAARRRELGRPADTYLLKSRSAAALELGAELAARGAAGVKEPAPPGPPPRPTPPRSWTTGLGNPSSPRSSRRGMGTTPSCGRSVRISKARAAVPRSRQARPAPRSATCR